MFSVWETLLVNLESLHHKPVNASDAQARLFSTEKHEEVLSKSNQPPRAEIHPRFSTFRARPLHQVLHLPRGKTSPPHLQWKASDAETPPTLSIWDSSEDVFSKSWTHPPSRVQLWLFVTHLFLTVRLECKLLNRLQGLKPWTNNL